MDTVIFIPLENHQLSGSWSYPSTSITCQDRVNFPVILTLLLSDLRLLSYFDLLMLGFFGIDLRKFFLCDNGAVHNVQRYLLHISTITCWCISLICKTLLSFDHWRTRIENFRFSPFAAFVIFSISVVTRFMIILLVVTAYLFHLGLEGNNILFLWGRVIIFACLIIYFYLLSDNKINLSTVTSPLS